MRSGKISALGSNISEKQNIVYISYYIEESKIGKLYQTRIVKTVHTFTLGMKRIIPLAINYINGVLRSCFRIQMN